MPGSLSNDPALAAFIGNKYLKKKTGALQGRSGIKEGKFIR